MPGAAKVIIAPMSFELRPTSQPAQAIQLTNVGDAPVIFRILSTQPKNYYVRPRHGFIPAGETVSFTITVIVNDETTAIAEKGGSDEFLVEYRNADASEMDLKRGEPLDSTLKISDVVKKQRDRCKEHLYCKLVTDKNSRKSATASPMGGRDSNSADRAGDDSNKKNNTDSAKKLASDIADVVGAKLDDAHNKAGEVMTSSSGRMSKNLVPDDKRKGDAAVVSKSKKMMQIGVVVGVVALAIVAAFLTPMFLKGQQ